MSFLILMALVLVVMYVLMIRPQRRRQHDHQTMIDAAGVGEDVLTTGGIYGTVTDADGDDIVVEIADGVSVHMTRRGIAAVLPADEEEEEDADVEEEDVVDADVVEESDQVQDEAPVTTDEEPVTSRSDGDSWSGDRR